METELSPRAHSGESESGQSLIEMAFAVPLLLLLLLGTIDIGRVFFEYIDLRHATTEGATYGARNPTDITGTKSMVSLSGVPAGTVVDVTTVGTCTVSGGQGTITVEAESEFVPLTSAFFARLGLSTIDLRSTTTMRCLT
jgi:Flp pilus assembly protein TadG